MEEGAYQDPVKKTKATLSILKMYFREWGAQAMYVRNQPKQELLPRLAPTPGATEATRRWYCRSQSRAQS